MNRIAASIAAAVLAAAIFAGCQDEGALEKAGRQLDETIDEITHPNEGALEKAGRKTDEAIEDLKKKLE